MCQLFKNIAYLALFIVIISLTSAKKKFDWWESAIIYEIYPRSFLDTNGDGVGDLKGISSKLQYLVDLGVTAIWLGPIFQSPMVDFGNDISNHTAIDPIFGSIADFEELVMEAKQLDIKILLDFVPNHTSDKSKWFEKSVKRVKGFEDYYIWADGKINRKGHMHPPNNWQSVSTGSVWTWNNKRQQYYLHQFTPNQPDLNYRNPNVKNEIDNLLLFWLDKGIDGFRVDAVNHLFESPDLLDEPYTGDSQDTTLYDLQNHPYTKDLPEVNDMLHHWRKLLDNYQNKNGGPTRILTTEADTTIKHQMDHYQYAHFPFNFQLVSHLDKDKDARDFVNAIQTWITYMPLGHVANWVSGNHNRPRVASRFRSEFVDAMNMLVLTLPGVAVTYYGDEIGMEDNCATIDSHGISAGPDKYSQVTRNPMQTPFQWDSSKNAGFTKAKKQWLPVHPNYLKLNLKQQQNAVSSHYKVFKQLASLRKLPAMREGDLHIVVLSRDVFAFKREVPSVSPVIIIVINVGNKTQTVELHPLGKLPKEFTVLVAASTSKIKNGDTINANNLTLQSFECLLLQGNPTISAERRAIVGTLIKSANIILVGLLMYKLWHNKWTKLNFNKEALF